MELLLENYSVFSERIVDIAKKFGLDTWNWFAIISSLIAVVSVVIAIKTLISQRATQRNTQPIMSKANLRILLGQKTLSILDSYLHLLTFQFFLYISDYRIKPSLHFWEQVKTDWADINEGLFFDHEQKYASIHHLREVLHEFNYSLRCFANTINTSDDKEYKELEIISIFNKVGLILNSIYDVLTTCLELNKEEVESFFNKNFIDVFETKYVLAFKHRYLKPDGKVVLHYFDDTDSSILMNDVYHYFAQIAFFFFRGSFRDR